MSLKSDVRRIRRGNIPTADPRAKTENVYTAIDIPMMRRADALGNAMLQSLIRDAPNLTPEGIANRNNKINLINQHLPSGREIPNVVVNPNPNPPNVLGNFEKGGTVKKTGLYKLHKGEKVIPAKKTERKKK